MGQCAPSSPSDYWPTSMNDDEIAIVVNPPSRGGCYGGVPLQRILFQNDGGDNTNKHFRSRMANQEDENKRRMHFLQAHQPDIPRRCVLDQSKIKRAIWLQSDELLRHDGKLKMNGIFVNEFRGQHGVTTFHKNQMNFGKVSEPSIVSGITSASNTTLVRKNKIQNFKSEGNDPLDVYAETYAEASSLSPHERSIVKEERNNLYSDQEMKTQYPFNSQPFEGKPENACEQFVQNRTANTNRVDMSERERCMPVLRLKMRANLGWFYTQHYQKMFPTELQPIVGKVPPKEKWIPELKCASSDGSFSSNSSSSRSDNDYCTKYGSIPATPIKCPITDVSLLDLAITGCLGLVPQRQDHKALGSSRREMRDCNGKIPDDCIVLINKRFGSPLAVCVLKERSGSPIIRIYATKQMAFAQKHETTTKQLGLDWADDLALYSWADVKTEGDFPNEMNFDIFMVNRFDGCFSSQSCYSTSFHGQTIDDRLALRSPVMKMIGRTDNERHNSGCALFWMQANETMSSDHSEEAPDSISFRINIAQGIDPALLICFTAIVDEILEKSMRTRCQTHTRGRIRKDSFSLTKQRLQARSQQLRISTTTASCNGEPCTYLHCNF